MTKKRTPLLLAILVMSAAALMAAAGFFTPVDRVFQQVRFKVANIEATGDIIFVGIDKKSIDEIGVWPWPRSAHGTVIEKLLQAGVTDLAVDIDFSTPSTPQEDAALAKVLDGSNGEIILPVFRQVANISSNGFTVLSTPIEMLADNVWLGAVNVFPEADGRVWSFSAIEADDGKIVPSMPALLAGQDDAGISLIEYGIDANTVPVVSASEILTAKGVPAGFAGKKVIYGAFATELGDIVPTPVGGAMPGPLLQLIAAETLLQDRNLAPVSPLWPVLAFVLMNLAFYHRWATNFSVAALVGVAFIVAVEAVGMWLYLRHAIVLPTSLSHAVVIVALLVRQLLLTKFMTRFAKKAQAEVKVSRRRLTYLSKYNELTDGLRRTAFIDAGNELLSETETDKNARFVMAVFRIERFDTLHISLGNAQAQLFIGKFAGQIRNGRQAPLVLGHLQDAVFSAIYRVPANAKIGEFCDRIVSDVSKDVEMPRGKVSPLIHAGFSIYTPGSGTSAEKLLENGEFALRFVDHTSHKRVIFDDAIADQLTRNAAIESALPDVWKKGELQIMYQPQINLHSGKIVGFECLLRWNHPQLGRVSPVEFISIAETVGLLRDIDMFVLHRSAQTALHLPEDVGISVNIAPSVLEDRNFAKYVLETVSTVGISPSRLTLEILETATIKTVPTVQQNIEKLHQAGIKIALDDFGTGNAGLENLMAIAFDKVKLDRAFVRDIGLSQRKQAILRTTRTLCDAFSTTLICEGVETPEELALLRLGGCDVAQGYYYAKPLGFDDALAFLESHDPKTVAAA